MDKQSWLPFGLYGFKHKLRNACSVQGDKQPRNEAGWLTLPAGRRGRQGAPSCSDAGTPLGASTGSCGQVHGSPELRAYWALRAGRALPGVPALLPGEGERVRPAHFSGWSAGKQAPGFVRGLQRWLLCFFCRSRACGN